MVTLTLAHYNGRRNAAMMPPRPEQDYERLEQIELA